MKNTPFEKVPLTEDEKDLLMTVYHTRRRFLLTVYAILIAIGFATSFRGLDFRVRGSDKIHHWEEDEDSKVVSRSGMWMINLSVIEVILIASGIYFYITAVRAYKLDADSGIKDKIPYTIIRKEYFPLTNQFFVGFDDPKYLHHEIDEGTYHQCAEGDIMYIYRAIRTKFVFEENGRFTLF